MIWENIGDFKKEFKNYYSVKLEQVPDLTSIVHENIPNPTSVVPKNIPDPASVVPVIRSNN